MKTEKYLLITACAIVLLFISVTGVPASTTQAQGAPDAKKRGGEILADAAAAAGGEALKKVESLQLAAAGSVNSPMGTVTVEIRTQLSYPDRMRFETVLEMGSFSQGFDGKAAWASTPQGTMDLPADFGNEYLRSIDLAGGIGLYKKALTGKAEAEFGGEKEFAGQKTQLVEWSGPSGKVRLYFDAATKLLAGAKYRAATMQGTVEEERRVSDYREVDGVKFPFHWVTYRDGALYSDLTVKDVKLNEKIDAGMFAKPQ